VRVRWAEDSSSNSSSVVDEVDVALALLGAKDRLLLLPLLLLVLPPLPAPAPAPPCTTPDISLPSVDSQLRDRRQKKSNIRNDFGMQIHQNINSPCMFIVSCLGQTLPFGDLCDLLLEQTILQFRVPHGRHSSGHCNNRWRRSCSSR